MLSCSLLVVMPVARHHTAASVPTIVKLSPSTGFRPSGAFSLFQGNVTGYKLPRVVIQTVKSKSHVTCQEVENIKTWLGLNPGYKHMLLDDADLKYLVKKYHPEWFKVLQGQASTEPSRAAMRFLMLYTFGGVYADTSVRCLKPIKQWNAENGFDAQVLVGMQGNIRQVGHNSNSPKLVSWVVAAAPHHPLISAMPHYLLASTNPVLKQAMAPNSKTGGTRWHQLAQSAGNTSVPQALTAAVLDYMHAVQRQQAPSEALSAALHNTRKVDSMRILSPAAVGATMGQACLKHGPHAPPAVSTAAAGAYVCRVPIGRPSSKPWRQQQQQQQHQQHQQQDQAERPAAAGGQEVCALPPELMQPIRELHSSWFVVVDPHHGKALRLMACGFLVVACLLCWSMVQTSDRRRLWPLRCASVPSGQLVNVQQLMEARGPRT